MPPHRLQPSGEPTGLGRGKRELREVRAAQLLSAALALGGRQQPFGVSLPLESG
jgi:hypothetical protein